MSTSEKSIKGTQTEKNIVISYLSESAAYSRYNYYAQQADKENYYPIGQIFRETADNELHHGKVFFKMLQGGKVPAILDADAGVIGTTAENLKTAAEEERSEGFEFYKKAAETAREEGFDDIAAHFDAIAEVEMHHRRRFLRYLEQVNDGTVWKRDTPIKWICLVCGFIYEGTTPPDKCPACDHPYQHYMAMEDDNL